MDEMRERELERVRGEIDAIDATLVGLMRDRVSLALKAADSKRARGGALRDTVREAEVIRRAAQRAREFGVDDEAVRQVFWKLIDLSHRAVGTDE